MMVTENSVADIRKNCNEGGEAGRMRGGKERREGEMERRGGGREGGRGGETTVMYRSTKSKIFIWLFTKTVCQPLL